MKKIRHDSSIKLLKPAAEALSISKISLSKIVIDKAPLKPKNKSARLDVNNTPCKTQEYNPSKTKQKRGHHLKAFSSPFKTPSPSHRLKCMKKVSQNLRKISPFSKSNIFNIPINSSMLNRDLSGSRFLSKNPLSSFRNLTNVKNSTPDCKAFRKPSESPYLPTDAVMVSKGQNTKITAFYDTVLRNQSDEINCLKVEITKLRRENYVMKHKKRRSQELTVQSTIENINRLEKRVFDRCRDGLGGLRTIVMKVGQLKRAFQRRVASERGKREKAEKECERLRMVVKGLEEGAGASAGSSRAIKSGKREEKEKGVLTQMTERKRKKVEDMLEFKGNIPQFLKKIPIFTIF